MAGRGRPKLSEDEQYPIDKHKYKPKPGMVHKQYKEMMSERLYEGYLAVYKMFNNTPLTRYEKQMIDKRIDEFLELL